MQQHWWSGLRSGYGDLFKQVWGAEYVIRLMWLWLMIVSVFPSPPTRPHRRLTPFLEVRPVVQGKAKLSKQEQKGFCPVPGEGKCKLCHISNGQKALFTDYTFDNLGVPKNPENPIYDRIRIHRSRLGGFLEHRADYAAFADENMGKHKVRLSATWAWIRGGYYKSLRPQRLLQEPRGHRAFLQHAGCATRLPRGLHRSRGLAANCWPAPEVAENVNTANWATWA